MGLQDYIDGFFSHDSSDRHDFTFSGYAYPLVIQIPAGTWWKTPFQKIATQCQVRKEMGGCKDPSTSMVLTSPAPSSPLEPQDHMAMMVTQDDLFSLLIPKSFFQPPMGVEKAIIPMISPTKPIPGSPSDPSQELHHQRNCPKFDPPHPSASAGAVAATCQITHLPGL